jgi:hypothetical protein
MNEILQWTVLFVLGLLMLGLFRQLAVSIPSSRRSAPEGPLEGRRLPKRMTEELARVVPSLEGPGVTLAFLSEDCLGCQRLIASLEDSSEGLIGSLALVVRQPSVSFMNALAGLPFPTIVDSEGEIWSACHVTATPLVIALGPNGRVSRKEVTHDVRRVALATG